MIKAQAIDNMHAVWTPENNGFVLWLKTVGTGGSSIGQGPMREKFLAMAGIDAAPAQDTLQAYADYLVAMRRPTAAIQNADSEIAGLRRQLRGAGEHPDIAAYLESRTRVDQRIASQQASMVGAGGP